MPSRPQRWMKACEKARKAYADLEEAFGELQELQSEYEEWQGNLPEGGSATATADKLEEIVGLELSVEDLEAQIDAAEGVELPRGFGRD